MASFDRVKKMAAKTKKQYAAEGITVSNRERDGLDVTQYVRGHNQWVKVIRQASERKWYVARGYANEAVAHDKASYSFTAYHWTWDDAVEHAARLIETWK